MLVASTPETTNPVSHPVRDRGSRLRLDQGAVAALVHRPAGQSRRRPASLEALQLRLSLLLGAGGRHRCLHQHVEPGRDQQDRSAPCFPTTATATPGVTSRWASRPCSRRQGYKLVDPGRYQNLTDNFSAQITAFKNAQCRDRHRRGAAAGFHDVLEAGAAAGLQAEGGLRRQGNPVPGGGRGAGQGRPQPLLGGVVVAEPSVQVLAHRHERQAACRCLRGRHQEAVDAADRLHALAVRGRRPTCSSAPTRSATPRRPWRRLPRPISTPSSARSQWNGKGVPPFAAKNVTKTPLVGGQWRLKDGNKYDIVITDNRTAPDIPVGGKMEAIG